MSYKEIKKKSVLDLLIQGNCDVSRAAEMISCTPRHIRRMVDKYIKYGDSSLIHGLRGRKSNNTSNYELMDRAIELYKAKYKDFGPTLAAEKIAAIDNITVNKESLRKRLLKELLLLPQRYRKKIRKRRERKPQFGAMLQIDGSIHQWFGGNEYFCLFNIVDDATGISLAVLAKGETTEVALIALRKWIEKYGVPQSIYVDLKSVYVSKVTPFTHFGLACNKLGIAIIKAYSPQAKGRVERKHAVFQDRFVKELKLKSITNIADANKLLENSFLEEINSKFSIKPLSSIDAHRDAKQFGNLDHIFCIEHYRTLDNDSTLKFNRHTYLLHSDKIHLQPKSKILVRVLPDNSLSMLYHQQFLQFTELFQPLKQPFKKHFHYKIRRGHKPSKDHPWRKNTQKRLSHLEV